MAAGPDRRGAADDPDLAGFEGRVSDSGEGRWTIQAAIDEAVPAPVLSAALYAALQLARRSRLRQPGAVGDAQRVWRPRREAPPAQPSRLDMNRDPDALASRTGLPTRWCVFGVTGDLAHKMIFPALYAMAQREAL